MAVDQWNGNGDWNLNPSDWSPSGAPPSKTTDAEIETGAAALTTSGTAAWLSIDAGAAVNFGDDALLSVAQWVQNLGALNVTGSGDTATIVGRLTNVGALNIGSGSLAATSTVTVGSLRNSGQIVVQGNVAGGIQAALKVTAAASATLTGSVRVSGDGAVEYGSGNITSVGVGASLELDGSEARVTSGAGGASALTLLAANHGTLQLHGGSGLGDGGATLTTTTAFTNEGVFWVDTGGAEGGSSVVLGGALNNYDAFDIGNASLGASSEVQATALVNQGSIAIQGNVALGSKNEALLKITGAAAATLTGNVRVGGDAQIAYASGAITAIQNGSSLELDGSGATIVSGATSALAQIATNNGSLTLTGEGPLGAGGATLTTTTGTNFTNQGTFSVDAFSLDGDSVVKLGGVFYNNGTTYIGVNSLVAPTSVTATGLVNSGSLFVEGNASNGTKSSALLSVTGPAAATLTGDVRVGGDAQIQYASGEITSIGYGSSLELDGDAAAITTGAGASSALADLAVNNGALTLQGSTGAGYSGATITTTVGFTNDGQFSVDAISFDGGSAASFGGIFANHGAATIGDDNLFANVTVSATGLDNSGTLVVQGSVASGSDIEAKLAISGAAGATLGGSVRIGGDGVIAFGSGEITSILSGASLELDGSGAKIESGAGSALSQLATNSGLLWLRGDTSNGGGGATLTTTTGFTNNGTFWVDQSNSDSGSTATFVGAFVNNGTVSIGEGGLANSTTVTATTLVNNGALTVQGNASSGSTLQGALMLTGAAAAVLTGDVRVGGRGLIQFASGKITSTSYASRLELDGAGARILTTGGTASALATLSANDGTIVLQGNGSFGAGGAKLSTGAFTNYEALLIDTQNGDGGSTATFTGLWNNNGTTDIGQADLSTSTIVRASNFINYGTLNLQGNASAGTTNQASIIIGNNAPAVTDGLMRISGDALLEYSVGGLITTVAASSSLELDGSEARITTGGTTNSALAELAANDGSLTLRGNSQYGLGGATITTNAGVAFANNGTFSVDVNGGDGASTATFGGVLTNNLAINVGNANLATSTTVKAAGLVNNGSIALQGNVSSGSTDLTTMDITGAAAAALTGQVRVGGDGLLEFGSGEITSIAASSYLELDGAQARITTGGTTASALAQLAENEGTLALQGNTNVGSGGAQLATTTSFTNDGSFSVDTGNGDGASVVSVAGTVTNDKNITIGNSNLSAPVTVTAAGLVNNGSLTVQGNTGGGSPDLATFDVTGSVAAVLNGPMRVGGDGLLEFAGGGDITTIAGLGYLELDGAESRITTGGATNSALVDLAVNDGTLTLQGNSNLGNGGAMLTTTASFANNGQLMIDTGNGDGGSSATFGGTLSNNGTIDIGVGNLSATTTVVASTLANNGSLTLQGNVSGGATDKAILDITGAASATTNGPVRVGGDAMLEFGSGLITTIGAAGYLELDGVNAEITTGGTTASALAKLATNQGTLLLSGNSSEGAGGATMTTTTGFLNEGTFWVDVANSTGGSDATLGGTLTNDGSTVIGNGSLSGSTTVTTAGLVNNGSLMLSGSNGAQADLVVNGATTNTGDVTINGDSELDVTGTNSFTQSSGTTLVGGTLVASTINANDGLIEFYSGIGAGDGITAMNIGANGDLEFASGVDSSHTVTFTSATGSLQLADLGGFAGDIAGFAGDDAIDLVNGGVASLAYSGTATAGTLTLTGTSGTLGTLAFKGDYTTASFALATDGHGGQNLLFV